MLQPKDLATFQVEPDGNLKVTLDRFGALRVALKNGQAIHVMVRRAKDGNYGAFVATTFDETSGEPKGAKAIKKANEGGDPPIRVYSLRQDGLLIAEETESLEAMLKSVGIEAAEAAKGEAEEEGKI